MAPSRCRAWCSAPRPSAWSPTARSRSTTSCGRWAPRPAAIRGYDEALDRLTAAGTVNPRDAQLAKLLLSAIAQPSNDGERVLNVPVTGQNGWLYVGPVRLARLLPLKLR
ncbi:MAG: DUF2125 domain-containing protein [Pseudomonadota bacterium]